MGCEQSTPHPLPLSIGPLYKNTSNDGNSGGVKVPVNFSIGKHNKPYTHQSLQTSIDNKIITVEASSKLVLKRDDIVFAVAKKGWRGYCVFQPTPVYTDQKPTNKHDGNALYEYATIKNRLVSFVHQRNRDPKLKIVTGPRNSFEKYLVDSHDNDTQIARWKYNTRSHFNMVTVTELGHDIGLILCLVIISDLIDVDEQMDKLSASGAIISMA